MEVVSAYQHYHIYTLNGYSVGTLLYVFWNRFISQEYLAYAERPGETYHTITHTVQTANR